MPEEIEGMISPDEETLLDQRRAEFLDNPSIALTIDQFSEQLAALRK